jgi:hypothetical protein
MPAAPRSRQATAVLLAGAAAAIGIAYAGVSAYWGAGGTGLLSTLGGTLERLGREHSPGALLVVWLTVLAKLAVSVLGPAAVCPGWATLVRWRRGIRGLAWLAAAVLIAYGGILTVVGVGVNAGLVHRSATADRTALRWHAYLWDPWFLLWGLLLAAAILLSRPRQGLRSQPGVCLTADGE